MYCVDLPQEPSEAWCAAQRYASSLQLPGAGKLGRLEYLQGDVTDQVRLPVRGSIASGYNNAHM